MNLVKIYHNPNCSKSRKALELLEKKCSNLKIIKYLEDEISKGELADLFKALGMRPKEVIRTKEDIYKSLDLDWENDELVIMTILENRKLLERPIVLKGKKAVIGRPPENVFELF